MFQAPSIYSKGAWDKTKTKFLVYGIGDTVIMKKLELPDLKKEWENNFKLMDKKRAGDV